MNLAASKPPPRLPQIGRGRLALALVVIAAAALIWWLLSLDKVNERSRNEEVEMIDIAVPPPPPPPPPEEVQPEIQPEQQTPTPTQQVQPDPLSPTQPPSTNPPAGDLSSLLQDPTADSGAFTGGPRGQGGTGKGPLIGGTGTGGAQASRAYAERVAAHVRRHVAKAGALKGKPYRFRLRLSVSPSGAISFGGASGVTPPELEGAVQAALRGMGGMDTPPPEGLPNSITVSINQS